MIFHINVFRLLPYNSRGDQFDGTLVVASDRYRPINYLYCHDALRLGLPMNQAKYEKLVVDIGVSESEYASTDRFPSCEIPYPVGIGVSDNGERIQEPSVINSKSGSSLHVSEYSLCRRCMHFERLNIVPAKIGDTEGDIRSTSKCRKHE